VLRVLVLVLLAGAPSAVAASADEIDVGGRTRTYDLHVPPGVDVGAGAPLVVAFHGQGGTGQAQAALSGMNATADNYGFVVVYPDGIDRTWHYGGSDIDDLAFVDALIDHLVETLGVDASRVYATGMSNGGFFSIFYSCARPQRVAALAPVAATLAKLQVLGCSFAPSLRIQMIAGTEDPLVPWAGNAGWFSVPDAIGYWVSHDQVSPELTVDEWLPDTAPGDGTRAHRQVYGDAQVELIEVEGGGHTWPGGLQYLPARLIGRTSRDFSANEAIWAFFAR